jgi:hypothetical protein
MEFASNNHASAAGASKFVLNWTSGLDLGSKGKIKIKEKGSPTDPSVHLPPMAFHGSTLAFHTLSIFLDQLGDPSIYPSVHISLSFIWSLAVHPLAMQPVDAFIPWVSIARFLNTLIDSFLNALTDSGITLDNDINKEFNKIEDKNFPLEDMPKRHLPEDFLIRGQSWSQLYYPDKFFDGAPSEDDRPVIEPTFTAIPRMQRCLWLGVQIATVCPQFSFVLALEFVLDRDGEKRLINLTCSSVVISHTQIAVSTLLRARLGMHPLRKLVEASTAEQLDLLIHTTRCDVCAHCDLQQSPPNSG